MPPPIEKPIAYVVFCTTLARACTSATAARKKPTSSTELHADASSVFHPVRLFTPSTVPDGQMAM